MKAYTRINLRSLLAMAFVTLHIACRVNAEIIFSEPLDLGLGMGGYVSMSTDGLELYFCSIRQGGLGQEDIWHSARQSVHDPWAPPTNVLQVNSGYREAFPSLSPDGLTLYFSDYFYGPDRPGGLGHHDLWMSTRPHLNAPWSTPVNLGAPFNSAQGDVSPTIACDGLTFLFASMRDTGNYDLYSCTRATVQDAWGVPCSLGPVVNSSSHDYYGNLSPDGLVLLFESNRSGSYAGWMATRNSIDAPWTAPVPLPNPIGPRGVGCFRADGMSFHAGMSRVTIVPILDMSGNGVVDMKDLLRLIEAWGQEDSNADFGPAPLGDGIVNAIDLEVLMTHWGREVDDPTLRACYKLDERMGTAAYDSGARHDAFVVGQPKWHPEGGQVDGALQLDGTGDYLSTPLSLNPSTTVFSVFAWVNGDTAGRIILSQEDGVDWLLTDSRGHLMTGLISAGRRAVGPLVSEVMIIDGAWHRVGLAWDGGDRILYVDDVEVARDTLGGLKGADGNLNIGAGTGLEADTFWSGMIDDVRIYNRVVVP